MQLCLPLGRTHSTQFAQFRGEMEKTTLSTEAQWNAFFRNCDYLTEYFKKEGLHVLVPQEERILVKFANMILEKRSKK